MGYNTTGWYGSPVISMGGAVTFFLGAEHADIWAAITSVATMDEIDLEHEYIELPGVTHGPVITISQEYIY